MDKVLLVSVHIEDSPRAVPLGPAMIASNIQKRMSGVEVELLDLYLNNLKTDCIKKIEDAKADYIGFSIYVWNRDLIFEIISQLKKDKNNTIFIGGSEATADFENLSKNTLIDYVVKGEGEDKIIDLFETILNVEQTGQSKDMVNLSEIPSPYLDGTLNPSNYKGVLWELSRGCPFRCDFCFESRGKKGIRRFPMERITKELKLFKEKDVSEIFVLDPTFNYNKTEAKKLLRLFIDEAPYIHYSIEIRAEFIDEEIADLFSQINCSLQIGLQSSDPEVLKAINRTIEPETFSNNILLLHELEIVYGFDLIYGLPLDTLDVFFESLNFALSLAPNHIDIFPLSVLPGTKLFETADSFGLIYQKNNPYSVIESDRFCKNDMALAGEIAKACEVFYNNGKSVPWFLNITNGLGMEPSEFFKRFISFVKIDEITDIFETQKEFLKDVFEECGKEKEGKIASDMSSYFGYTASLIEERKVSTDNAGYVLNPDHYLTEFNFNPDDLLSLLYDGVTELSDLKDLIEYEKNYYILFIEDNEVSQRALNFEEYEYLTNFQGQGTHKKDQFLQKFIEEKIIWRQE
jgi:radical SAM superfamily enzyme YgiQ (UPF0313 family)